MRAMAVGDGKYSIVIGGLANNEVCPGSVLADGDRIFALRQAMVRRLVFDDKLAECTVLADDFLPL